MGDRDDLDERERAAIRGLAVFADLTADLDRRTEALIDPMLPTEALIAFVDGLDGDLRELALRVAIDEDALDHWARTGTATDRHVVAANRCTDAATLDQLAQDPDPALRALVAANPATAIDTLAILLADPAAEVRSALSVSEAMRTPIPDAPEDRPGGADTFDLLYDLVGAAEELDCIEQLRIDELRARGEEIARQFLAPEDHDDEPDQPGPEIADPDSPTDPPPSLWQAIGLVRYALDAVELTDLEREHEDLQYYLWLVAHEPAEDEDR